MTFAQFKHNIKTNRTIELELAIEAVQEKVQHTEEQYQYALYSAYMAIKYYMEFDRKLKEIGI